MKTIPLKDATHAQLFRYATVNLNLPSVQPNTGDDKLRERIKAATGENVIYAQASVDDDEPIGKRPRTPVNTTNQRAKKDIVMDPLRFAYKDPRFLINIAAERGKGGKTPVAVSVNGTCMLLPRGEDIEVPARYFFALRLAVATIIEDIFDDKNMPVRQETEVPQYQFSVLRSPTQQEIDDWQDMLDDLDVKARGKRARQGFDDEDRAAA